MLKFHKVLSSVLEFFLSRVQTEGRSKFNKPSAGLGTYLKTQRRRQNCYIKRTFRNMFPEQNVS